jgi:hypothetical protein
MYRSACTATFETAEEPMVKRRMRSIVAVVVLGLLCLGLVDLGSGSASAVPAGGARPDDRSVSPRTGLSAGMMPTRSQTRRAERAAPAPSASPGAHLTYFGGPVVSNAAVVSVLWGPSGTYLPQVTGSVSPNLDTFFTHVTNSAHLSWLHEYDTSGGTNQSIGYGSFVGRTTISPSGAAGGTTIDDPTLQTELLAQINNGRLPAPTLDAAGLPNTIYALFFPEGTTICTQGVCSGQAFCAYHSSFTATVKGLARNIRYMVLPHPDANIVVGCASPTANTAQRVLQSYTSHELVETITDPDVGLATTNAAPLAWYDPLNGEISDICQGEADAGGTVTGTDGASYVVQKEWSNALNRCIVDKGSTVPSAPSRPSSRPGASRRVDVSWGAPTTDGGTAVTGFDVYRSAAAGSPGLRVASLPATATRWTSGPLGGRSRQYFGVSARNVNGSGPMSNQVSVVVDAAAPVLTVTRPSRVLQLSRRLTTSYRATDSGTGVAGYDVQYRKAAWNGRFGPYTALASGTAATTASLTGQPGHEYCFRQRARDKVGNISAWSHARCAAIPLDDRSLKTSSGWRRLHSSSAYGGTLTGTTRQGAKLILRAAHAHRLGLIVAKCPSCGRVAIYLNGSKWHTVDTAARTRRNRAILLPGTFRQRTPTIVLQNVSSKGRVLIDGLVLAHR